MKELFFVKNRMPNGVEGTLRGRKQDIRGKGAKFYVLRFYFVTTIKAFV